MKNQSICVCLFDVWNKMCEKILLFEDLIDFRLIYIFEKEQKLRISNFANNGPRKKFFI